MILDILKIELKSLEIVRWHPNEEPKKYQLLLSEIPQDYRK